MRAVVWVVLSFVSLSSCEREILLDLPRRTPLRILGAAGSILRVRLHDGTSGFVSSEEIEMLENARGGFPY